MKAALKHELRAYLHSSASYAVGGLFFLISAVYYSVDNIRGHSGDLSALYSAMGTLLIFIVPILTSRIIAEDRRSGLETLLFTSPTNISGIVAGKFFAVLILLVIIIALTLLFPLILLLFTPLHPLSLLGHYTGLALLGAAIASLGIFASALTESQVVAAIISFVSLLALLMMRPVSAALGGIGSKILAFVSPYSRFDEFGRGVFSLGGVIYFVGFAFLFLYLTAWLLTSRRNRGIKNGANWARLSAVSTLAIVLALNLLASLFPMKIDFSEGRRYSIGEATRSVLLELSSDITIYALFDDGKADRDYQEIRELLEAYKNAPGGHIFVEYRDPDVDTGIISALDPDGTIGLRKNNFYVTNGAKGKKLVYGDLFQMQFDGKTSAWFVTGSTAERVLTETIRGVAETRGDTVYLIADAPDAYNELQAVIQKTGYAASSLDLDRRGIPDNAISLLFLAPENDLTEPQLAELRGYLSRGGSIGAFVEYGDFPNWEALLVDYSIGLRNAEYKEQMLDVTESEVIPLAFFGLYLPSARALEVTGESTLTLAEADDGAPLAAAAKGGGKLFAAGSAEYLSDVVKERNPAVFVTNMYFTESVVNWLLTDSVDEVEIREYRTGELQIPGYKANFIGLLTVVIVPLAIFGRGFIVWRRRRYL
ncbi:MAG: Gldg family protein [Oscillospiraceae bacterium]|jgi:ABC-2 type transport system permease protein|nr:Gldg family protein [Oscillospiraceae bacterium]